MKNNVDEIREKILKLKNDGMNNKEVALEMNLASNTISYHLKKINYKHKKIKCKCENTWCGREFEIVDYIFNIDPEIHKKCKECRLYEKECLICKKFHNNQGITCSDKCAYELKKESWLKSCGTEHNFSKNSSSRIKWENELKENFGVINVFQKEEVKLKIKKSLMIKYNVEHPSQIMENYIRRRIIGEELGILIPLNELSEYQIYRNNVFSFTQYNLRIFGENYFGENWKSTLGCKNINTDFNIDHIYSIKNGFMKKIPPYVIGSIVNLRLILFGENISKSDRSDITIEELYEKYEIFEANEDHNILLEEMKNKRSKYYDYYLENKYK